MNNTNRRGAVSRRLTRFGGAISQKNHFLRFTTTTGRVKRAPHLEDFAVRSSTDQILLLPVSSRFTDTCWQITIHHENANMPGNAMIFTLECTLPAHAFERPVFKGA